MIIMIGVVSGSSGVAFLAKVNNSRIGSLSTSPFLLSIPRRYKNPSRLERSHRFIGSARQFGFQLGSAHLGPTREISVSLGGAPAMIRRRQKQTTTHLAQLRFNEPPQVNLPHVDTQLNMHQFTSFLDDSGATDDQSDSQTSPSHPPNPSASPNMNGAEAPTEWSAVGHAATGKSGRVIHNLQEEIARLTRECSLYRSRAEETQRSNEALKIQVQNINERLRNLEQVNETNLNSIARKDRKVDELRAELASERTKRQEAETNTSKTNETMREEREQHHREQARAQEIAKYHETQYEVFAGTTKREKADMGRRLKVLWNEVQLMAEAQKTQDVNTERLDVLADQKNREVEGLKETHEKLLASHVEYKRTKDNELRGTIERAHDNNAKIDLAMESLKKTEAEMKWAIQLAKNSTKD